MFFKKSRFIGSRAAALGYLAMGIATLGLSACDSSSKTDVNLSLAQPVQAESGKSVLPSIEPAQRTPVTNEKITNLEAPVPSQCYTKTEDRHNPCYTCHQMYDRRTEPRMNMLDDGGLQGVYLFSDEGLTNHWENLFTDRREWQSLISDDNILTYVNQDNYTELAPALKQQNWKGFIPDLQHFSTPEQAFDEQGFAKDASGWVAFNYKPFPGTFWPTNGSTDDVIIRLPEAYRELSGQFDRETYLINLSLVELTIKNLDRTSIPESDERRLGVDLDGDGELNQRVSTLIKLSNYVGDASAEKITFQQYPAGTEFMHSVRYVGTDDEGNIFVPQRMKELRYMRKLKVLEQHDVNSRYARERKEKNMGKLPDFVSLGEKGMENGMGWILQGFIEDYDGALRPQTYEETLFCMGCHAAVGANIDQTFAMARKVTGREGWGYINLKGMRDAPNVSEPDGEILNYFKRAGGGSEFRENPEMLTRWFTENGMVDEEKVRGADVYSLITPSRERALQLNKAYTHIVRSQSYIYGRDATWLPAQNVFRSIDESTPPLPVKHRHYGWDIRLDWSSSTEK